MRREDCKVEKIGLRMVQRLFLLGWLAVQFGSANVAMAQWVTNGPFGGTIYSLVIDPQTRSTLYAGTGGGVFKSTDEGGNWIAMSSGLASTYVNAIAIDPQTPSTLYAGAFWAGVFKSR